MQFSDETLMAYADGELDADTRRQIETAMASDPTLAERIDKHRALRMNLGAAFGSVLDEPVPSRLLDAANSTPAKTRSTNVTDLNAARAARLGGSNKTSSSWSWPQWTAIAASLLIGVLAGRSDLRNKQSDMFATSMDGVLATGVLSGALDDQLSGSAPRDTIRIGLTFTAKDGSYCRSFTTGTGAGFACHENGQWRIRALNEAGTHGPGGEYRMAGSQLPSSVLAAIDDVMEGEALDRQQEIAARERGWNK